MSEKLRDSALHYHEFPSPGKIAIQATKPLTTQRDLSLAYSPGVGAACEAIVADPSSVSRYTSRGNLVAVITNGTAVLGYGAIGPLAAKPVMEGKAVLFKKFAGIDAIDLEISENDPDKLIEIIAALEPSFGGINLEDIKAPECFAVENTLRQRMKIPVFHDDQHGTAIIVGAALTNWLHLTGRKAENIKLVCCGAGAAALACLDMLVAIGVKRENILVNDLAGVVYKGRNELMDARKEIYARETTARTLSEIMTGADVFLGLSAAGVLKPEMLKAMSHEPLIMALANPNPEILPEEARAVRPDATLATGRSDYSNQINNVLCFPFIFRGALDVGATTINEEMKLACVKAIADLARKTVSDVVSNAYGAEHLQFGHQYLIPKPFDPRLILEIAPAVAKAAMETGVATKKIEDFNAYKEKLEQFVFRSGLVMRPVFAEAKRNPKKIIYCEGEDERILHTARIVLDEGFAKPILLGRTDVIKRRIERLGLNLIVGDNIEVVDTDSDHRYHEYWQHYYRIMSRRGVTPAMAKTVMRTDTTVIGSMLLRKGVGDAMICGLAGEYPTHLEHILNIVGLKRGVHHPSALSLLVLSNGSNIFMCDTHVSLNPNPDETAEMVLLAAEQVRRFGIEPKVALLSHSSFGSHHDSQAQKVRMALAEIQARDPALEVEGEMQADAALSETVRERIFPDARLKASANLLVMPSLESANICFNTLRVLGDGLAVGPILLGARQSSHILTASATVRSIVNMSAIAIVDAQALALENTVAGQNH
ncbi:MAG: NADP-dependent malic enzyme [Alphaproteobacteria bacterium]